MADGCAHLPKVIVLLALLCRISYQVLLHDDLLDRIKQTQSNDPDVRDFLRSVLRHHGDFRWITNQAEKFEQRRENHALPLRGLSSKNKRSYYATLNRHDPDQSKPITRYVYRHDAFDNDDANAKYDDVESFAGSSEEENDKLVDFKDSSENLDFDGPVNDIYPYQDNRDVPQEDRRFVRETQDSFLYDDRRLDDDDMLDGAVGSDAGLESGTGEEDDAEFVSEDRHDRLKRSANTGAPLARAKIRLSRFQRNRDGKNSKPFSPLAFHMPGDAIEVIPNSKRGVNFVPGTKLERYGDFVQSEQDQYNQEDLEDMQARNSPQSKLTKRKCDETLMESDFKVPDLFDANKTGDSEIDVPLSEFYFSSPHDVAGLNQDILANVPHTNSTCIKYKKSVKLGNTDTIKIKIFDNGQQVKNIEKDQGTNTLVLTVKNPDFVEDTKNPKVLLSSNQDPISKLDNTLETIDRIIKHDETALKGYSSEKPSIERDANKEEMPWIIENSNPMTNIGHHDNRHHPASPTQRTHKHKYSEQFTNEQATVNYVSPSDCGDLPKIIASPLRYSGASLQPFQKADFSENNEFLFRPPCYAIPQNQTQFKHQPRPDTQNNEDSQNSYQNRLEDLTEPTSAAEQKELGRLNYDFHTDPINMQTTSEQILIIPFRKVPSSIQGDAVTIQLMIDSGLRESGDFPENPDKHDNDHRLIRDSENFDLLNVKSKDEPGYKRFDEQPKADAFRSRKLFSIEEETIIEEDTTQESLNDKMERNKKDIRKALGMNKDEDYSEDKIDFFGGTIKKKQKKEKEKKVEDTEEVKMRQRLLGSIINSQQERRALKARLAKTKGTKVKKDVQEVLDTPENEEAEEHYQQLIVNDQYEPNNVDNNLMTIRKIVPNVNHNLNNRFDITPVLKQVQGAENLDRCCQNTNATSESSDTSLINDYTSSPEKLDKPELTSTQYDSSESYSKSNYNSNDNNFKSEVKSKGLGNELDIIEKTQAILLHITGSDDQTEEATPNPYKERDAFTDELFSPTPELNVKRLTSYKVTESDKDPEDVVSEIIKLVQNYKNRVSEYNSKNKHASHASNKFSNNRKSDPKDEDPFYYRYSQKHKYGSALDDIDMTDSDIQNRESTTKEYMSDVRSKVLESGIQDDVEFHSHMRQKPKKLHPTKDNKCRPKEGSDQDMEFMKPVALREVYNKPEVLSDADSIVESGESNSGKSATRSVESEEPEFKESPKKNKFFPQKRIMHRNNEPSKSTLEPLENQDMIDNTQESENKDVFSKREDVAKNDQSDEHQLKKRELNNMDEYTEEELNKIIGLVDDAKTDAKVDRDLLKRYRRFKNFEPFYKQHIARVRHQEPGHQDVAIAPSTVQATTEASNATISHTQKAPICGDIEYNPEEDGLGKNKKKKKRKHKCSSKDDDSEEFGDICSLHGFEEKKTKAQIAEQNRNRELNHEKINLDRLHDKQKEEEHIRNILNGHAVLEIMDKFRSKVKENGKLNSRFGEAMSPKCARDQVDYIERYKEEQTKADVRHAQLMLHQVIVLMNKIVAEQVHRRTCILLSPSLKNFLKQTANSNPRIPKPTVVAEGYPLPGNKDQNKDHILDDAQSDFLFPTDDDDKQRTPEEQARKMKKKIAMIRALLSKYNHLTQSCRVQVTAVHDYLIQHLRTLEKLYHDKNYIEVGDICEVPCVHNASSTTRSPNSGMTTIVTAISPISSLASTLSIDGTTLGGSSVVAKARAVTYEPPVPVKRVKATNMDRTFRGFDSGADADRDSGASGYPSVKYKKLVEAAANYRRKRQIEERLARLFGRSRTRKSEILATTATLAEDAEPDLSNVAFEAPMVYSLH